MSPATVISGAEPWSAQGTGERGRIGIAVVHGLTGNPISTRPVGEQLNKEGWTVEVPRLPGHGTNWRDMMPTRWSDYRAAVDRVVDDLGARCDQVVAIGLSMGGALCLDVASRRPQDISAVAAINAPILARGGLIGRVGGLIQHVLPAAPRVVADMPPGDIASPSGDEQAYGIVPSKAAWSVNVGLEPIRHRLDRLTMPVLIAWSPQDHTVPAKNSRWLAKQLEGRDVTTVICERSYHVVTLDHDAEMLNDALVEFVARATDS